MPREREGYREMIEYLQTVRNCPDSMNISQTATFLGKNRTWVYNAIRKGALKQKETGEITVGAIARYMCG